MIIYQLAAKGTRKYFDSVGIIHSRLVFSTEQGASDYIGEYKKLVSTDASEHDLLVLDPNEPIEITIHKLDLVQ